MKRLARRMTLLYAVLVFVASTALIVAFAAFALIAIDRSLAADLHGVAARVPAALGQSRDTRFSQRAAFVIGRLGSDSIAVSVREAGTHDRFTGPAGPPPQGAPGPGQFDDTGRPGGPGGLGGPDDRGPGGAPDGIGPITNAPPPMPVDDTHESTQAAQSPFAGLFALENETVPIAGGTVTVAPTAMRLDGLAERLLGCIALALAVAAVIAALLGRLIANRTLKPLGDVVSELTRFGSGDFSERTVDGSDEVGFGELAVAYNAAATQVRLALGERVRAEAEMRRFIADAAHELRTPLTVVMGYVELLRDGVDRSIEHGVFTTIELENRRMRDLISNLLALARLDAPQLAPLEPVDLSSIIETALDEAPALTETNDVHVDIRTGAIVLCDPGEMHDALSNLLLNASKYAPGAALHLSLKCAAGEAILEVADDGPGMSATDRDNAFRRFYRGELVRETEGSGLGLSIVERVVSRAHGKVSLTSAPGAGTRFTIALPLVS